MSTSGSFNTSSVGNFYFTFEWYRTGYNSSVNEHYIHWTLYAHNTPGSYRTVYLKNLWVNGTQRLSESGGKQYYDGNVVASGDTTVSSHNSAGDGWFSASFEAGIGISSGSNCSGDGSWDLDRIPRYTTVWNSERGKTINTISINWSTSDARDWTQYSLNDGAWQDAYDAVDGENRNGHYTIHNLQPNTTYKVRTRCRRADSALWSEADNIWITTYDYAKINSIPGFNLGDNETIGYSNPSGNSMRISIHDTEGSVAYCGYRQCTGSSYTFEFTQEELDRLYKLFKNNTVTVRVYLVTTCNGVDYYNYHDVTVTLTGNQKTVEVNNDSTWKRGKIWTNVEGMWKRAIIWTNVYGIWKKSI